MCENSNCCSRGYNSSMDRSPSINHRKSILHTITSRSISNISNMHKLDESPPTHSAKIYKIPIYHKSVENVCCKPPPAPSRSSHHHDQMSSCNSYLPSKDYFRSQLYPKSSFRSTTTLKYSSRERVAKGADAGGIEIPIKFLRFDENTTGPSHSHSRHMPKCCTRTIPHYGSNLNIKNNIRVSSSSTLSSHLSKSMPDLELNVEIKTPNKDIRISRKFNNPVRLKFNYFLLNVFFCMRIVFWERN